MLLNEVNKANFEHGGIRTTTECADCKIQTDFNNTTENSNSKHNVSV